MYKRQVADIVDEAILGVDVMNAYGFIVDFKNCVLRIGGEEVMLSTMTTAEKSMDIINQVAVTVPVSYTHLDVYKRQHHRNNIQRCICKL